MKKFYLCKLCLIVFGALLALKSASAGFLEDITWQKGDILEPITSAKDIQFDDSVQTLISKGFNCDDTSGQYRYCELYDQTMTILGQMADVSINLERDKILDITFRIEASELDVKKVLLETLGNPFYAVVSSEGKAIPYMTGGVYWIANNKAVVQARKDFKNLNFTDIIFSTPLKHSDKYGREFFIDIGAAVELPPSPGLDGSDF